MQVIIKRARQSCADSGHLFEIPHPGAQHPLQSAEVRKQRPAQGHRQDPALAAALAEIEARAAFLKVLGSYPAAS